MYDSPPPPPPCGPMPSWPWLSAASPRRHHRACRATARAPTASGSTRAEPFASAPFPLQPRRPATATGREGHGTPGSPACRSPEPRPPTPWRLLSRRRTPVVERRRFLGEAGAIAVARPPSSKPSRRAHRRRLHTRLRVSRPGTWDDRHCLEAMHVARMTGDQQLETRSLADLSLIPPEQGRDCEALFRG